MNNNAHNNMLANATKAGINFSNYNPPKEVWFESDGLKLHYLDWGNKNDQVCILLHGFAQTAHSWDFISLSLSFGGITCGLSYSYKFYKTHL